MCWKCRDHRSRLSVGACIRSLGWSLFYCSGETKVGAPLPSRASKYTSCIENCSKMTHRLRSKLYYFAKLDLPVLPWLWFWDSFCMWVHVFARVFARVLRRINRYHLLYCTFELRYLKANATPATDDKFSIKAKWNHLQELASLTIEESEWVLIWGEYSKVCITLWKVLM